MDNPKPYVRSFLLLLLVFLLLQLYITVAQAEECYPTVTLASYHFDREHEYNERNYGYGVGCSKWAVGRYRNSEGGRTTYALYNYPLSKYFGIVGGVVHGYTYSEYMPLVALSAAYGPLRFIIIPPISRDGVNQGVIGVQVVFPIKLWEY